MHTQCKNSGAVTIIRLLTFCNGASDVRVVWGQCHLHGCGVWRLPGYVITEDPQRCCGLDVDSPANYGNQENHSNQGNSSNQSNHNNEGGLGI
jgi:hypothetical protein